MLSQKYSTSISTGIICRQIAVVWLYIAQTVYHSKYTGPHREIFPGGTKIDAGSPKSGEDQKKGLLKFGPTLCPKSGEDQKKGLHSNLVLLFAQNQVKT